MFCLGFSFVRKYKQTPVQNRASLVENTRQELRFKPNPEATIWTKLRNAVDVRTLASEFVCTYVGTFARIMTRGVAAYLANEHANEANRRFVQSNENSGNSSTPKDSMELVYELDRGGL
jgi:hypothetical protein